MTRRPSPASSPLKRKERAIAFPDCGITGKTLIDVHCHGAGLGAGSSGCFISSAMQRNWRFLVYLKAFGVSREGILKQGDGVVIASISKLLSESRRVDKAVVLAMDGVVDGSGALDEGKTEIYVPNDFIAVETARYDNLLFGASINPYRRDALELLEKEAARGAALLKWLPPVQLIDPSDKRLVPFYRRMAELGLPLLSHTGTERSFTFYRDELGDPDLLRLPLECGVKVIAAHVGGHGRYGGMQSIRTIFRLWGEYENLYSDISGITQANVTRHPGLIAREKSLLDRLLYGTDMPLINTPAVTPLAFLFKLNPIVALRILRIDNPWDRDVALKEALGLGPAMGMAPNGILRMPQTSEQPGP